MGIKTNAIHATQLGVIAALVDGQVSQVEKDTLVAKVSERFRVDAEEVTRLAKGMIEMYQELNISTSPAIALHYAVKSLDNLSTFDKRTAFDIAEQVIVSGGMDGVEKSFLAQLKNFARV